jgi:hypothetical protein
MTGIDPGDDYVVSVLPAVTVLGCGLTLVVAPISATVFAASDPSDAGIASGINNGVSRVAGLVAVAALPLIGHSTGRRIYDVSAVTHGFHVAMLTCAILATLGGVVASRTISPTLFTDARESEQRRATPVQG